MSDVKFITLPEYASEVRALLQALQTMQRGVSASNKKEFLKRLGRVEVLTDQLAPAKKQELDQARLFIR